MAAPARPTSVFFDDLKTFGQWVPGSGPNDAFCRAVRVHHAGALRK